MSLMQNFLWLNNKLKFKAGTDAHILEGGGGISEVGRGRNCMPNREASTVVW